MTILVVSGEKFAGIESTVWYNLFLELVKQNPGHRFVLVPHKKDTEPALLPNLALSQPFSAGLPLLKSFRRQFVLNRLISEHKASVLMAVDDFPPAVSVPTIMFLADDTVKKLAKKGRPDGRFVKAILASQAVIVPSEYSKHLLTEHLNIPEFNIAVCSLPVAEVFKPANWEEKQVAKERFAAGREYFLYNGPVNASPAIITLLKAFSLFKKRQMSNMQLMLAGHVVGNSLQEKLSNYKYRADVQVLEPNPEVEIALLTASAYACIDPHTGQGFSARQLQAICSATPVISCSDAEPFCDAVIRCRQDAEAMADKMKQIYKDENYRNSLVKQCLQVAGNYKKEELVKKLSEAAGLTVISH